MPPSVSSSTAASGATDNVNDSNTASITVQVGEENLSQVAQRLGVDFESLRRANPQVSDSGKVQAGQDIQLPPSLGQQASRDTEVDSIPQSHLPPAPTSDPLARSAVLAKFGTGSDATHEVFENMRGNLVQANTGLGSGSGSGTPAPAKPAPNELPEIKAWLTHPAKNSVGAKVFADAQKDIEAGNYTSAFQKLDNLLKTQEENLWEGEKAPATAMRNQLQFLSQMQKAGIKADYPPTEAQLVDYFKTLKDNPDAARQAFDDYAKRFQVHPVNVSADKDFVIHYSHEDHSVRKGNETFATTTDVPRNWSDVSARPVSSEHFPQYIARQMNDCKGYAFMAEKLLGAAGFQVAHHLDAAPSKFGDGHMMVAFTHPKERGQFTLTSNDGVFRGRNETELAKQGFAYAAGGKDNVTGREHYFTGRTAAEAEIQHGIYLAATRDGTTGIRYDQLPR